MSDLDQERRIRALLAAVVAGAAVFGVGYFIFGVLDYKPSLVIGGAVLLASYFL